MEIISREKALYQELEFYFTGKPCKRSHVCERRVINWVCLKCEYVRSKNQRQTLQYREYQKKRERRKEGKQYKKKYY